MFCIDALGLADRDDLFVVLGAAAFSVLFGSGCCGILLFGYFWSFLFGLIWYVYLKDLAVDRKILGLGGEQVTGVP